MTVRQKRGGTDFGCDGRTSSRIEHGSPPIPCIDKYGTSVSVDEALKWRLVTPFNSTTADRTIISKSPF